MISVNAAKKPHLAKAICDVITVGLKLGVITSHSFSLPTTVCEDLSHFPTNCTGKYLVKGGLALVL